MKKPKNLEFEPVHPKNLLLASVVHGISCLFKLIFEISEGVIFVYTPKYGFIPTEIIFYGNRPI
jgi:hypothetical protein